MNELRYSVAANRLDCDNTVHTRVSVQTVWLGLTAETDDRQTDHAMERCLAIGDTPEYLCIQSGLV